MFFIGLIFSLGLFFLLYFIFSSGLRHRVDALEKRMGQLEQGTRAVPMMNAKPAEQVGVIPNVVPQASSEPMQNALYSQGVPTVVSKPKAVENPAHSMETFANRMAKLGIVVLAIGVLYFLSYINSRGLLGETAKFTLGLIAGAACVGIAELVKRKSSQYAQILRGGGFIIWYITLYIGTFSYHIITLPVMLGLIIGILFISALVSLSEKKETSFFLGVLGAYLLPWIAGVTVHDASTNLQLLIYVFIINCGIVGLAMFQNWRASMYAGFFFTWILFLSIMSFSNTGWVGSAPTMLSWTTLWLFATLYGLQFLIVFLSRDIRRGRQYATEIATAGQDAKPTVKEGEVFLTATNTFLYVWFSYSLIYNHFENYLGFLALALGIFHLGVYLFIRKMQGGVSRSVSALTHFVIFIVLVTAAIPMQFDGPIVTMVWFIEGVVLAYLATTNEFKNRGIMYVLGLAGIVMGVMHMIAYGEYQGAYDTGIAVVNQQFLVWLFVVGLIHFIAYLWKNIEKVRGFALFLFLVGQVFFVVLSSVEIWSYFGYQQKAVNKAYSEEMQNFEKYYGYAQYSAEVTPAQRAELDQAYTERNAKSQNISNTAAFVNAIFFVIMTTIYLLIGLLRQNKVFRRLGVVMLVITLIQIVSLAWQFGPVYRFITFLGLGVILLVLSYLYIHHSKKIIAPNPTN